MALHYRSGQGKLYDKDAAKIIAQIKYKLVETEPTKYTNKKWWGEFSINHKIKKLGDYILEFEDGRAGGCYITTNTEKGEVRLASLYHYRFFGRGKLGRSLSFGER